MQKYSKKLSVIAKDTNNYLKKNFFKNKILTFN